jgi:hypothetical protein
MSNIRKRRLIPLLRGKRQPSSNVDRKFLGTSFLSPQLDAVPHSSRRLSPTAEEIAQREQRKQY